MNLIKGDYVKAGEVGFYNNYNSFGIRPCTSEKQDKFTVDAMKAVFTESEVAKLGLTPSEFVEKINTDKDFAFKGPVIEQKLADCMCVEVCSDDGMRQVAYAENEELLDRTNTEINDDIHFHIWNYAYSEEKSTDNVDVFYTGDELTPVNGRFENCGNIAVNYNADSGSVKVVVNADLPLTGTYTVDIFANPVIECAMNSIGGGACGVDLQMVNPDMEWENGLQPCIVTVISPPMYNCEEEFGVSEEFVDKLIHDLDEASVKGYEYSGPVVTVEHAPAGYSVEGGFKIFNPETVKEDDIYMGQVADAKCMVISEADVLSLGYKPEEFVGLINSSKGCEMSFKIMDKETGELSGTTKNIGFYNMLRVENSAGEIIAEAVSDVNLDYLQKEVDFYTEMNKEPDARPRDEVLADMDKLENDFKEKCEKIAEECAEEGYPSMGSNYDLRCESLWEHGYKQEMELLQDELNALDGVYDEQETEYDGYDEEDAELG